MKPWNRLLWGIQLTGPSRTDPPILIGTIWLKPGLPSRYPEEPTRALLYCTREAARDFCRQKHAQYADHEVCSKWRFRPVRVRESVEVEVIAKGKKNNG